MTDQPPTGRWRIRITASDGRQLLWRKQGQVHTLSAELGPVWVANFRPAIFQVTAEGALVPRGEAGASDVARVDLEPA